tara:strand:- start:1427 stop:2230 length:804 start_codon:yes stop_codon:yes gene_type:complete
MTTQANKTKQTKKTKTANDGGTPLLSAKDLTVLYDEKQALSKFSLELKTGEVFGLIGLNGAGKTTFIKVLLGLLQPDEGKIALMGKPVTHPDVKPEIVSLPEKFEPPHFLSGREFIHFALGLYGQTPDDERIEKMAGHLALEPSALDRAARYYSKGMKQKIGLMSCFMTDCPVIVLDEPMSGLDPLARARVKQQIAYARTAGRTVFFSSHVLSDIDEICDRIAIVDEGLLKFEGTSKLLKNKAGEPILENAFLKTIDKYEPAATLSA